MIAVNYGAATFSWVSFIMPASMIEERLNLTVTLFLAEVAFCFILANDLPKVPYLTLVDHIILASFVMLFLLGIQSSIAYILTQQEDTSRWFSSTNGTSLYQTAEDFDKWSCLIFSTTFTLWNALHLARGFRNRYHVQMRANAQLGKTQQQGRASAGAISARAQKVVNVSGNI